MIEYSRKKLTYLLLKFGAATENQLLSYFNSESHSQIFRDLRSRYFDTATVEINIVNSSGSFESRKFKIFFISENHRRELRKFNKSVKVFNPASLSWRVERLYHELLVLEAFIYLTRLYRQELSCLTELELKSYGENPADLRIFYIDNDEEKEFDCEIVVKNHRHQINSKSSDMIYFTPLQSKKDFIDESKLTETILINLDFDLSKFGDIQYELTNLDKQIIEALTNARVPLDATALAVITQKDRSYLVPVLNNLVEEKFLHAAKISLENNKCNKLFALNSIDLHTINDRMFSILFSKSVVEIIKNGSTIIHLNMPNHIFITENEAKKRRIYYVDNLKLVGDEVDRFEKIKIFAAKINASSLFIASSLDRFLKIRDMYNEPNVYLFR